MYFLSFFQGFCFVELLASGGGSGTPLINVDALNIAASNDTLEDDLERK